MKQQQQQQNANVTVRVAWTWRREGSWVEVLGLKLECVIVNLSNYQTTLVYQSGPVVTVNGQWHFLLY